MRVFFLKEVRGAKPWVSLWGVIPYHQFFFSVLFLLLLLFLFVSVQFSRYVCMYVCMCNPIGRDT